MKLKVIKMSGVAKRATVYLATIVITLLACNFSVNYSAWDSERRDLYDVIDKKVESGEWEAGQDVHGNRLWGIVAASPEPQQATSIVPATADFGVYTLNTNLEGIIEVALHDRGSKVATKNAAGRVVGRHRAFAYLAHSSGACYIQVFDVAPGSTVTVGTTTPAVVLPVQTNSSLGFQQLASGLPLFTVESGIAVVATTTQYGNTACASPTIFSLIMN